MGDSDASSARRRLPYQEPQSASFPRARGGNFFSPGTPFGGFGGARESSIYANPDDRHRQFMDRFGRDNKALPKLSHKKGYLSWLDQIRPYLDAMGCLDYLDPCSPRFGEIKPPFLPDFEKRMLTFFIDAVRGLKQRAARCTELTEVMRIVHRCSLY